MGYLVAIVDTKKKLSYKSYKKRYDGILEYADGQNYKVSSQRLQSFFLELKDIVRPLNGEFAANEDECDSGTYYASDYGFSQDAIWIELTFPDVYERNILSEIYSIARKHGLTFFDVDSRKVVWPNGVIRNKETDKTILTAIIIVPVAIIICCIVGLAVKSL
jgi:hypothetical protein